ncbi:MAG: ubiquinol-cytochrome c reductase iron-sulfur subunit [Chloroflexi bacterium]|nr:ubiquinol-cytochrome c reductase iron-sulfur subunit [Chloroflexota bacterium]MCL5273878.1 ubiquinol-cytochrome c reductase iron-sulfur subunit [Chloroflexota bacterium]
MARSPNLSRRGFIMSVMTFAGSIMGIVVGLPVIGFLISPALNVTKSDAWVPVGKLDSYPVGVPTPFSFTRTKVNGWEKTVNSISVFVLRDATDKVRVFSSVCTHLGCRVTFHKDSNEFICPCHDAHFNKDGGVVSGPPPRPLDQYESKVENGALLIHVIQS